MLQVACEARWRRLTQLVDAQRWLAHAARGPEDTRCSQGRFFHPFGHTTLDAQTVRKISPPSLEENTGKTGHANG